MAGVQEYLGAVVKIFGNNGGSIVGRYRTIENLSGESSPEMVALISFPDVESVRKMMSSEEYNSLEPIRSRSFTKLNLVICSEM